jgi:UDP-3-O-[3-hydroxymyristoyl] glucosamine N-acyltransferase
MSLTIAQLAQRIGAELVGDGEGQISAIGTVASASESTITFAKDDRHIAGLKQSRAGAVIVGRRIEDLAKPSDRGLEYFCAAVEACN